MSYPLEVAVFTLVGFLALLGLTATSLFHRPSWLYEDPALEAHWKKLVIYSFISGLLCGILGLVLSLSYELHGQSILFGAVLGYLTFQAFFTDFRVRYVDRWVLRLGSFFIFLGAFYILYNYGEQVDWLLYLTMVACAFGLGFLPGIGDSDGRAFGLLVLAVYPTASLRGLQLALILVVVVIFAYTLGALLVKKNFSFKSVFSKLSFPMVPLTLLPALLVSLGGFLLNLV